MTTAVAATRVPVSPPLETGLSTDSQAGPSQVIPIPQTLPGLRLDAFLKHHLPTLSRGALQRMIAEGHIRVDGRITKPTHRPHAGEQVQIHWAPPRPATAQPESIPLDILFEDKDLLVLNKSPDIVVHPSAGHSTHTLVNALLHHCQGQLSGIGGTARPGIVHRLDQETSGCLVVAKNDLAHLDIATQFARREVHKVYEAIVCGHPAQDHGEIDAAIARHPNHRKRMAVTRGKGRPARTSYRVLEHLHQASLIEAILHTGRTHQIRVHCHSIGHPLVGDPAYGRKTNARLAELTGYHAPRQLLHASTLTLRHPVSGIVMKFIAPRPRDIVTAIVALTRQAP